MNIHRVNSTMTKAIALMQEGQLSHMMGEEYTGTGGSFSTPMVEPDGDPLHGGDGGVDNMEVDSAQFDDFIEYTASSIAEKYGLSANQALQAIVTVSAMKASEGMLPPMPDAAKASAEHLATWAGAAKTAGLQGMVMDYLSNR